MGNIAQSLDEIQDPTDDIQNFMLTQLATLRVDVLKYQVLFEDCQKAQQSSDQLSQQLATLKEKHTEQEQSLQRFREEAKGLGNRNSLLKSKLETRKAEAGNHGADPAQLQQETDSLRSQVEQAKKDSREARTTLSDVQNRFQAQLNELTAAKVSKFIRNAGETHLNHLGRTAGERYHASGRNPQVPTRRQQKRRST